MRPTSTPRPQLRAANDEITRLRKLIRGTEAVHREVVMLRALGADALDGVTGRAFASSYEGELSAETVKAAWTDILATAVSTLADKRSLHELATGDRRQERADRRRAAPAARRESLRAMEPVR